MRIFTRILFAIMVCTNCYAQLSAQISGTKTIGGTLPDYATISAAISDLQASGINGNVVFNIRDGVYDEKLNISTIVGSNTYTITFQSESADMDKVKIIYSASTANSADVNLINLESVKNIVFKNMTFSLNGNYKCNLVHLTNGADSISFQNNLFQCLSQWAFIVKSDVPMSSVSVCKSLTFSNNKFEGGYSAIDLHGNYYGTATDITIDHNTFSNQQSDGIYLNGCEGISIKNNTIQSLTATENSINAYGIGIEYGKDFEIIGNKIFTSFGLGISIVACSNLSTLKKSIYNNVVTTKIDPNGINGKALGIDNSTCVDVINNSLRLIGGNTGYNSASLMVKGCKNINIINNILHNNEHNAIWLDNNSGITQFDYNYVLGKSPYFAMYNNVEQADFAAWKTASSLDVHSVSGLLNFVSDSDLYVNSSLINNKGLVWPLVTVDIENQTRSTITPDIGAYEFTYRRQPPVIKDQTFTINENVAKASAVGTVVASDPEGGPLTYSIVSDGNKSDVFSINSSTGEVTVKDSSALNYEVTPTFSFSVMAQNDMSLSSVNKITINLTDVNEAPAISNQTFTVNENSVYNTTVGTVLASDVDASQTLTYSITAGNSADGFSINSSTGAITVNDESILNFEATPSFALTVQVKDNGTGKLASTATITINLTDVNEAPVISNQTFSINENSAKATKVGLVVASDQDANQLLTYSIIAGNTSNAFAINSSTGAIEVNDASQLNYESTSTYALIVQVQDNGTGTLTNKATVNINLTDVNEAPVISNQTFSINENSAKATNVGLVVASDQDAGQVLTYSIIAGNTSDAFAINSITGNIIVNNAAALNYEKTASFALTIQVQDNGSAKLANTATITINIVDVVETGITNKNTENVFLYPNPSKGQVFIKNSQNKNGYIEIYDGTGKCVLKTSITNRDIDLAGKPGIYFIKINTDNTTYYQKLIIQ